jgi:hypothetical protein
MKRRAGQDHYRKEAHTSVALLGKWCGVIFLNAFFLFHACFNVTADVVIPICPNGKAIPSEKVGEKKIKFRRAREHARLCRLRVIPMGNKRTNDLNGNGASMSHAKPTQ